MTLSILLEKDLCLLLIPLKSFLYLIVKLECHGQCTILYLHLHLERFFWRYIDVFIVQLTTSGLQSSLLHSLVNSAPLVFKVPSDSMPEWIFWRLSWSSSGCRKPSKIPWRVRLCFWHLYQKAHQVPADSGSTLVISSIYPLQEGCWVPWAVQIRGWRLERQWKGRISS